MPTESGVTEFLGLDLFVSPIQIDRRTVQLFRFAGYVTCCGSFLMYPTNGIISSQSDTVEPPGHDITNLIADWQAGDKSAEKLLFETLHRRLHSPASRSAPNTTATTWALLARE